MSETKSPKDHWFMIVSSWDVGADDEAVQRFSEVYQYLNLLTIDGWRKKVAPEDPRQELNSESILALNLIGRRQFVIICQAASNRVLQELSKKISLGAPIEVDIIPATNVHDLSKLLNRPH